MGWYLWRHYLVGTVEPNPGHLAVAAWQDHAEVSVITQNVDDLHERAGSLPVHHLDGSLFDFRCATCNLPYTGVSPEMREPTLEVEPPTCDCGGLIRPDIVWFGEALPEEPWQHAVEATTDADVLVVVGTSGIVYPAAGLPDLALARGVVVVEVNPEPTPLSSSATITVRESASTALPTLLQRLPALPNRQPGRFARPSVTSHRQRNPRRQRLLGSSLVDLEPAARIELSVLTVRVAITRQPRPYRRVDELLEPARGFPRWPYARDNVAGHRAAVAKTVVAEPNPAQRPSTAPASTLRRQTARWPRNSPPSYRRRRPGHPRRRPRSGPVRPAAAPVRRRRRARRNPGTARSWSRCRHLPREPGRQPGQILPAELTHLLGFMCGDGGPDPGEERVVDGDRGRWRHADHPFATCSDDLSAVSRSTTCRG